MSHKYEISYGWFNTSQNYLITILDLETYELYEEIHPCKDIQRVIYSVLHIIGLLEIGNSLYFIHSASKRHVFVRIVSNNYILSPKLSKLLIETLSLKYSSSDSIFEISEIPDLLEGL